MLETILKWTTVMKYFHAMNFSNNSFKKEQKNLILKNENSILIYVNNCSSFSIDDRLVTGNNSLIRVNCLKQ